LHIIARSSSCEITSDGKARMFQSMDDVKSFSLHKDVENVD